jgi:RHS repeat-associated protein
LAADPAAGRAVMLVVDTSGSMLGTPLSQAKAALTASVDALQPTDAAGLRSYGGNCGDGGRVIAAPATGNRDALRSGIDGLAAGGNTPTPDALQAAVGDFPTSASEKLLILVSDGQSTCGDPCPLAQTIKDQQGVNFRAYTVGFNAAGNAEDELQCIARVTGGQYFQATDTNSLQNAINSALGGGGQGVSPSQIYGSGNPSSNAQISCSADPVNCATGNFVWAGVDITVPVRGPGLGVDRTYNSLDAASTGMFGHGWSSRYDMSLAVDDQAKTVTVAQENGSGITFTAQADGTYSAPDWVLATLSKAADGWELVRRKQTRFAFDTHGRLTSITDLNDESTTLAYDADGHVATAVAAGRRLAFTTDTEGRITSVTGPMHRTMRYSYSPTGDLSSAVDPSGSAIRFGYDTEHRMTSWVDPLGATTRNVYDSNGRVVTQTNPLGEATKWDYSGTTGSGATTIMAADGSKVEESFIGNLLVARTMAAGSPQAATTKYSNDSATFGVASVTDPLGRVSKTQYDADGNPVQLTAPDGTTTSIAYDDLGNPTSTTDALGHETTATYDGRGNLTKTSETTSAGQAITSYGYDAEHHGELIKTTDPEGRVTRIRYNSHGDPTTSIDPLGSSSRVRYNAAGEAIDQIDANGGVTKLRRDVMGRVIQLIDPVGSRIAYTFDAAGRLTKVIDPNGAASRYTYDLLGRTIKETLADGTSTASSFNNAGLLVRDVDKASRATTYSYDSRGLPTQTIMPGGRKTTFVHDAAGQLTSVTDPAGRSTQLSYTANGQLAGLDYAEAGTADVKYTYDVAGRRISMSDGSGTSTYTYDGAGQLLGYQNGAGSAVGYSYDRSGLLTKLTYPGGKNVTYSYDGAGRTVGVTDWRNKKFTQAYTNTNLLAREVAPNGARTTWRYGKDLNLTGMDVVGARGRTLLNLKNELDPHGYITNEQVDSQSQSAKSSYRYDVIGQITGVTSQLPNEGSQGDYHSRSGGKVDTTYSYSAGQLASVIARGTVNRNAALGYDAATGELTSQTITDGRTSVAASYAYDQLGQRTAAKSADVTASYDWNQAGRMTRYSGPVGGDGLASLEGAEGSRGKDGQAKSALNPGKAPAKETEATYAYDGNGLRASKTVGSVTSRFTYNPLGSPASLLVAGDLAYVYGPGGRVIEQLSLTGSAKPALYLHADRLGSTRLTTGESAQPKMLYDYTPFGQLRSLDCSKQTQARTSKGLSARSGTSLPDTNILFTGSYHDAESGLYYLISRYYDPSTAQFLSVDPLMALTGSPYGYADNNPLNATDLTGLFPNPLKGIKDAAKGVGYFVQDHATEIAVGAAVIGATACVVATVGICGGVLAGAGAFATGAAIFGIGAAGGATLYALSDTCHTATGYLKYAGIGGLANLGGVGVGKGLTWLGGRLLSTTAASGVWGLDALSQSGGRVVATDLTRAGQELAKHSGQGAFPIAKGSPSAISRIAQGQLDDILGNPGTTIKPITQGNFQGGRYYIAPDGRGAAFDSSGAFQYFGVFTP